MKSSIYINKLLRHFCENYVIGKYQESRTCLRMQFTLTQCFLTQSTIIVEY